MFSFLSLTTREKHRMARTKGLCFSYLKESHWSEKCKSPPCRHCQFRNHRLLHLDVPKLPLPENQQTPEAHPNPPDCFLDPESQTSFVKKNVADELGLDGKHVKLTVSGFAGGSENSTIRKRIPFTLTLVDNPTKSYAMEALTADIICQPIRQHKQELYSLHQPKLEMVSL